MTKTPTIKSEYTFEQFEAVFQKLAYQLAVEAIQSMPTQEITHVNLEIIAAGPKIRKVAALDHVIEFSVGTRIDFSRSSPDRRHLSFAIEPKIYCNSPHSSRISFYPESSHVAESQVKINSFLAELMTGIKPDSRFKLTQVTHP